MMSGWVDFLCLPDNHGETVAQSPKQIQAIHGITQAKNQEPFVHYRVFSCKKAHGD